MLKLKIGLLGSVVSFIISCTFVTADNKPMYCGYELTMQEFEHLRAKVELQKSPYEADSIGNIYDQLNDSIRAAMPDSVVFEVFLTLLNKDEVCIDIYVPRNKEFFEKISCAIMNLNYTDKMPEQRYMCLYTYTNPDGSGDIPFEVAIKRKR